MKRRDPVFVSLIRISARQEGASDAIEISNDDPRKQGVG
jgi:hypothetical protein